MKSRVNILRRVCVGISGLCLLPAYSIRFRREFFNSSRPETCQSLRFVIVSASGARVVCLEAPEAQAGPGAPFTAEVMPQERQDE